MEKKRLHWLFALALLSGCVPATEAANSYTLKSGERVLGSQYLQTFSTSGRTLMLQLEFAEEETDSETRNSSLAELVVERLLPTAVSERYDQAALVELTESETGGPDIPSVPLQIDAFAGQMYQFELGDNWTWKQTSGSEIDFSVLKTQTYTYNAELGVYLTEPIRIQLSDSFMLLVLAHLEGASPTESAARMDDVFRYFSGCSDKSEPVPSDSFFGQSGALALSVHFVPSISDNPLQSPPYVALRYGHENGVPYCYTAGAQQFGTWDDIYDNIGK